MAETYQTFEEATKALMSTAHQAAALLRQESDRARQEAGRARQEAERAWTEIESVRGDILSAKAEISDVRSNLIGSNSETQRLRTTAKMAWGAVGVMAVLVMVAVGWTASVLTRSNSRISHLNEKVVELTAGGEHLSSELTTVRGEREDARLAQARAEGELRAVSYTRTLATETRFLPLDLQFNSPPTRPSGFKEIINRLMGELRLPQAAADQPIPLIPPPDGGSGLQVTELPARE